MKIDLKKLKRELPSMDSGEVDILRSALSEIINTPNRKTKPHKSVMEAVELTWKEMDRRENELLNRYKK